MKIKKNAIVLLVSIILASCTPAATKIRSTETANPTQTATNVPSPSTPQPTPTQTLSAMIVSPSAPYTHVLENIPVLGEFRFKKISSFGHYTVPSVFPSDLDNDGDIDLILASEENNSIIQVYENLGDATFRNSGNIFQYQSPDNRHWNFGITVADFNEDGLPDIATADAWAGMNIYQNMGRLQFAWRQNYVFPEMGEVKGITSADLNHDNHIDIILGDHNGDSRGDRILFNDGTGFMVDTNQSINWDVTWDLFAIDINRDGNPDYLSVNRYNEKPAKLNLNDGSGIFNNSVDLPDFLDDSYDVKCFAYGDYTYCFIANSSSGTGRRDRILTFDKSGKIIADTKFDPVDSETKDLCIVDMNLDSTLDIITGNYNNASSVYLAKLESNEILSFNEGIPLFPINQIGAIGCADFNSDGLVDFVIGFNDQDNAEYQLLLQESPR